MSLKQLYLDNDIPSEIANKIEELNDQDYSELVVLVLQENNTIKQKAFARCLASERFWETRTPIFLRIVSLDQSPLSYHVLEYFKDIFMKNGTEYKERIKQLSPGLFAYFIFSQTLKLPPATILKPEFFFGQLLIAPEANEKLLLKMILEPSLLIALKKLLRKKDADEIFLKAKTIWLNLYGHILPVDDVETAEDEVKNEDIIKDEKVDSKPGNIDRIRVTIKNDKDLIEKKIATINTATLVEYPLEVQFLVGDTTNKIEMINNQKDRNCSDFLLSLWIRSSKNSKDINYLIDHLIKVHEAFGLESQRAMLFKITTLYFQGMLDTGKYANLLVRYNLIEQFFVNYHELHIDVDKSQELIYYLIDSSDKEQIIEGLLDLSNSNHEVDAKICTNILLQLIENDRVVRRIINQRINGKDSRLMSELISKLNIISEYNKEITIRLEEKENIIKLQKDYTLQEVGEAIKDILRTMEIKAAELIQNGEVDQYFIHFMQVLRKQLSRVGLEPVEEMFNLGREVKFIKGIHIRDGSGEEPFTLKSIGLKSKGVIGGDYLLDHPRIESIPRLQIEEGELDG